MFHVFRTVGQFVLELGVHKKLEQVEVFRRMKPAQRLDAAMRLYWTARELKTAAIEQQYPQWTAKQVRQAVNEFFLFARG
ncbi:MAG: hypothetical protein A2289_05060 [Deltaproteobacteria bacterium RIFOXYA12_FULL_58_15]|nr:MAG: hypothetical protein A2289_05060 [Deltaproteobacteria bacterium RIFOXYA12_FULL_58_15]